jgi:hypothetical protein
LLKSLWPSEAKDLWYLLSNSVFSPFHSNSVHFSSFWEYDLLNQCPFDHKTPFCFRFKFMKRVLLIDF